MQIVFTLVVDSETKQHIWMGNIPPMEVLSLLQQIVISEEVKRATQAKEAEHGQSKDVPDVQ